MQFDERYEEYVALFNERYFYDAHEALEDLWMDTPGNGRRFYQGLIHLAAAFYHLFKRNMAGTAARLASSRRYLADYPNDYEGLDLRIIRDSIGYWEAQLASCPEGEIVAYDDRHVPVLKLI